MKCIASDSISAVILVGGRSRRMNFQDKMNMKIGSESFLERILKELSFFSHVTISANEDQVKQLNPQELEESTGISPTIVVDKFRDIGPLGGLYSVMNVVESKYYFVVSCDMPFVTSELIHRLVKEASEDLMSGRQAVVATTNGRVQPLFAIYTKQLQARILEQIELENYRMMNLLDKAETRYIELEEEELLSNINTLEEFKSKIE